MLLLLLLHLHICSQLHHHFYLAPHHAHLKDLSPSPNSMIKYVSHICPTPTAITSAYLFLTASSFLSCLSPCSSEGYLTIFKFYDQLCSSHLSYSYSFCICICVLNCIIIFIFKLHLIMLI